MGLGDWLPFPPNITVEKSLSCKRCAKNSHTPYTQSSLASPNFSPWILSLSLQDSGIWSVSALGPKLIGYSSCPLVWMMSWTGKHRRVDVTIRRQNWQNSVRFQLGICKDILQWVSTFLWERGCASYGCEMRLQFYKAGIESKRRETPSVIGIGPTSAPRFKSTLGSGRRGFRIRNNSVERGCRIFVHNSDWPRCKRSLVGSQQNILCAFSINFSVIKTVNHVQSKQHEINH